MTTWCNHLNKPARDLAVLGLTRAIGALEARPPTSFATTLTVGGREHGAAAQLWSAELIWRDDQALTVTFAVDLAKRTSRITISEDLRSRLSAEPKRGYGMEAAILSDWLAGFERETHASAVRAEAANASDRAAALVEAAAMAFDQKWDHLVFHPGRGGVAPRISMWKETHVICFASSRQPGVHRVFSRRMARILASDANAFVHVRKEGFTRRRGTDIRIGAAAPMFISNKDPGPLALLRMLSTLPDGVHL